MCDQTRANAISRNLTQPRTRVVPYQPSIVEVSIEPAPIDASYVEGLHAEIKNLVHFDQQHGGVAAAPVIVRAYKQMRHRVTTSEIRNGLHQDVYSALSEVAGL